MRLDEPLVSTSLAETLDTNYNAPQHNALDETLEREPLVSKYLAETLDAASNAPRSTLLVETLEHALDATANQEYFPRDQFLP